MEPSGHLEWRYGSLCKVSSLVSRAVFSNSTRKWCFSFESRQLKQQCNAIWYKPWTKSIKSKHNYDSFNSQLHWRTRWLLGDVCILVFSNAFFMLGWKKSTEWVGFRRPTRPLNCHSILSAMRDDFSHLDSTPKCSVTNVNVVRTPRARTGLLTAHQLRG